jgi:GT2 family glycosyltransferase
MIFGYVCTNYNNSAYTQGAVRSLLSNGGDEFRVVVVDNNSDSKNVEVLKNLAREFRQVELILNKENVGYFPGLNMGIRHLRSSQPDIKVMVVGNNDLVFPTDFADTLKKNLSTMEKYGVVAPDITLDGVHRIHVIRKISKPREFIYDLYYKLLSGIAIMKLAGQPEIYRGQDATPA